MSGWILEAAEGNPLFVDEMLGMLIDDGLLRSEDAGWVAVEDLANVTLPPTIQLLLAARLDRLDAEERAVIERGSVEGKVFHTGAVATLSPETLRPNVSRRLLALARKELIRPDRAEFAGEDAFRFRHLLIRDAAYQAMPKEQRAELHERFARWLERVAGARVAEYDEILGHHLEQAYRFRAELGTPDDHARELAAAAAERLVASAERAEARADPRATKQLLRRALDLAEGLPRARVALMLAQVEAELSDYQASVSWAREARSEAEYGDDRALTLRAEIVLLESRGQTDPTQAMTATLTGVEAIRRELEELDDQTGVVEALLVIARQEFYAGRCDRAREIGEEVLTRRRFLTAPQLRSAVTTIGVASYFGTTPVEEALAMHPRLGAIDLGIVGEAGRSNGRFALLAMAGRTEEALAQDARNDRMWEEIGDPGLGAQRWQSQGEGLTYLGRLEEAERAFRRGVEILGTLGETGFNSTVTALHATALCSLGRFAEAEAQAARSRDISAEDDFASQVAWRRAQAWVWSARGDHAAALGLVDEATAIVEKTEYLMFRADTAAIRGLVLRTAGRNAEAREAYRRALELYERKGAVPLVARMRRELETLAGA
ncbi:MAG TPA: hypothetical protein VFT27_06615 [Actinomycetota bacterium]|nr:hypothetical protein [Actinomycetota bacterium]